jgi:hypothetical protein
MRGDRTMQDGRARSSEELWAGLVAEVAVMPDVVANLLREHQPDDQGFCTGNGCGTAGRGVPTVQWPCALHTLATEAKGAGASQRAPASKERTAPESRPSDAAAKGAGASQRAPASKERTAPESRPSDAAAKGAGASPRAPADEERTGAQATEDERPISTAAAWLLRRR